MESLISLFIGVVFSVISFFAVFRTERFVKRLLDSKRKYLESQRYSEDRINQWLDDGTQWYTFYRFLGAFGLIVGSIVIYLSIRGGIHYELKRF
jgi:hypothetical protein